MTPEYSVQNWAWGSTLDICTTGTSKPTLPKPNSVLQHQKQFLPPQLAASQSIYWSNPEPGHTLNPLSPFSSSGPLTVSVLLTTLLCGVLISALDSSLGSPGLSLAQSHSKRYSPGKRVFLQNELDPFHSPQELPPACRRDPGSHTRQTPFNLTHVSCWPPLHTGHLLPHYVSWNSTQSAHGLSLLGPLFCGLAWINLTHHLGPIWKGIHSIRPS